MVSFFIKEIFASISMGNHHKMNFSHHLYLLNQYPKDIKQLNLTQLQSLADEIRAFLIENIQKTGGHLAPNLGTIEMSIAMHYVFDTPKDSFKFSCLMSFG
jgi:deoxyxylulose-5-phosphate synthase